MGPLGRIGTFVALAAASLAVAGAAPADVDDPPQLSGFSPSKAVAGQVVTVSGLNLQNTRGVAIGGLPSQNVVDPSGTWVKARVPGGIVPGQAYITLDSDIPMSIGPLTIDPGSVSPEPLPQPTPLATGGQSAKPPAPAAAPTTSRTPRVDGYVPISGRPGTRVTLDGANFGGVAWVKFGGVKARFKVVSPTALVATVPTKARSGRISVHTAAGTGSGRLPFAVTG